MSIKNRVTGFDDLTDSDAVRGEFGGGADDLSSYPDATGAAAGKVAETDGADGWALIDTPVGGGASSAIFTWTRDADDALTSLAGLTTNGATWDIDAGQLRCVSTSGSWRTVRIDDNMTVQSSWVLRADVQLEGTFGAGDFIRLAAAPSTELAANNNFHGFSVQGNGAATHVIGAASAVSIGSVSVSAGWHTIELASTTLGMFFSWDGVQIGGRSAASLGGSFHRPFLWVYGTHSPHFRNMIGWSGKTGTDVLGTLP